MRRFLVRLIKNKFFIFIIILFLVSIFLIRYIREERRKKQLLTYKVKRQNLVISVVESGNVIALKSLKIINQVPGSRNILEVVDEGTEITEEDVKNKKVLIRLDSKDLEDKADQLRIDVENSLSAYTQALQELEIVKKQNESDITEAELKVKFAKMDIERYLGKKLSEKILSDEKVDYEELINNPQLGGEAWNIKKDLENKIDIAKEELERARNNLEWSKKLAEKGYITKNELEADKLSFRQKEANLEMAKLEYQLFINYDFPKKVEQLLSDYKESINELERVKDRCKAKLIQAESNVRSKKATYMMRKNKLEEIEKQIRMCTIYATQPGFVIYPTSSRPWRSESPIQPGTTVRRYQELLNLPDFNYLGVEVQVHETNIKKIKTGQKAIIKIDAFPDKVFTGTVKKISLMPDARMKFLNPDLNIYNTQVAFDKKYDLLKPGMSAHVEIIVDKKENVIAIPVISVFFKDGNPYCYVLSGNRIVERKIVLGESNDRIVEVKEGLKEGEIIVMLPEKIGFSVRKKEMFERGKIEKVKKRKR
ncbi:efflux RND transporter periplasmic adaptor subunit [bacterium]|nr:efflux RND transporter periplasmic adaptor subunit [bacterium]